MAVQIRITKCPLTFTIICGKKYRQYKMSLSVFLTLLLKEEEFNGNKAIPKVTNRWFTGHFVTFTASAFRDISGKFRRPMVS